MYGITSKPAPFSEKKGDSSGCWANRLICQRQYKVIAIVYKLNNYVLMNFSSITKHEVMNKIWLGKLWFTNLESGS